MPHFAANLSMLYPEHAFLERFAAAAHDGFKAVECLFPYALDSQTLAETLRAKQLQQVLFNALPGDWDAGERGIACLPGREAQFQASIAQALQYAKALQCPRVHVMAGLMPESANLSTLRATYINNLGWAAEKARELGVTLMIEPINHRDMPRYFLNTLAQADALIDEIGEPNVQIQFDIYHCQITEGDVATKLRHYMAKQRVGHVQIAGVPMRHEPNLGELNYPYLFQLLDDLSYQGWVGCEYRPARGSVAGGTSQGLAWIKPYL